jgi:selenide,water dikinase
VLILSKPIGTGAINTAVKRGMASKETEAAAIYAMSTSARAASLSMRDCQANACTDVTGFGLLGHAFEMAKSSGVQLTVESTAVSLLPDVIELISKGMLTRGDKNNRAYVGDFVSFDPRVSAEMQSALFDPQTAGGLLISLPQSRSKQFLKSTPGSCVIGHVSGAAKYGIEVI